MTLARDEAELNVLQRLWIYQGERLPLAKTALLLAVFSAASINVSAHFGARPLPSWPSYAVAFVAALTFFFQLRAADEVKDADTDRRYRPERPIPRGLVSLKLIAGLGLGAAPVALLATVALDLRLIWVLALVWLWLGLMMAEFFVPEWLKTRPFVYLVSHMLIMPLIDLFVTACEWLPAAGYPPNALWLFLVLSFTNGCVLEIGRKIYAPRNEREGVETYSALLGPRNATLLWCAILSVAYGFLIAVGVAAGAPLILGAIGLLALAACNACAGLFLRRFDERSQKWIDQMSGLWVLVCYGASGFAPLALLWG